MYIYIYNNFKSMDKCSQVDFLIKMPGDIIYLNELASKNLIFNNSH